MAGKTLKTPQEFEFLRLNYRYLSKSAMSDELGCSVHAIEVAARAIGIDLEDVDERAQRPEFSRRRRRSAGMKG